LDPDTVGTGVKIVFFGTGDIGLPTLEALAASDDHELLAVFTQPDKPFGRSGDLKESGPKKFAALKGIPVHQPDSMRSNESRELLRGYAPDVVVVVAYGQILPKEILNIPSVACLNLHASILPLYRGASPIQGTVLAGDSQSGMTVMYMDEGLDTGDVLLVHKVELNPGETGGSLHDRLAAIGPIALMEALKMLVEGKAPRIPQDHTAASHTGKLKRSHGAVDWRLDAQIISHQIHAYDPWPGTFAVLGDGAVIKLFPPAEVVSGDSFEPGHIIKADRDGILVSCEKGALKLMELQLAGSRRMSVADFLSGRKLKPGDSFALDS